MNRVVSACGFVIAVAAWSVAGASGAASGGAAQAGVAKSVTFGDARGEDPSGADIATVTVSNGDAVWRHEWEQLPRASRVVTFRIAVPNRARLTDDMRVAVWIDADDNRVTGLSGPDVPFVGADFMINWDLKLRPDASLLRCSGTQCRTAAAKLRYSYANGATVEALASSLGNTERFRFATVVSSGMVFDSTGGIDFTNASADYAPAQNGAWAYRLLLRPKRLLVESFAATPRLPRAGQPFTVRLKTMRDDTGTAITGGKVLCRAAVGRERLKPISQRLVGARAACTFQVPAESAGKTLRGTIKVVAQGLSATKSFALTIR